ncbi:SDR family NAD(P)-dependent oxidoreductase [Pseudomonas syringae]|uniref:SDR family NAD(P)-dependent oxidoreductase n=1 Tax=Pseudomonas syringae TaxID=317 RepID=UPI000A1FE58A|nr:SDR family NAD(P)-dependent oxidoreductase [Pseudomonas syringae]
MADQKVWLITGASRGLGVHLAQAALTAGHAVVATGRDPQRVEDAVGAHEDLLTVKLRIPRSSGHPFHEHPATDSTMIRPPIPRLSGHP